jgi:hypothetical protein
MTLTGQAEVLETNRWQRHCVHYEPHLDLTWDRTQASKETDRRANNFLSHDTACCIVTTGCLCPAPYWLQQGAHKDVMKFSTTL